MSYGRVGGGRRTACSSVSKCSRGKRCVRLCRRPPYSSRHQRAAWARASSSVVTSSPAKQSSRTVATARSTRPLSRGGAHARGIDVKAARLGVFEKGRRDPRGQRIGGRDDGAGVIRNQNLEDAAEEGPCRLARLNRTRGRLLEGRIDKPIARADGGGDPRAESNILSRERQTAEPPHVHPQLPAR